MGSRDPFKKFLQGPQVIALGIHAVIAAALRIDIGYFLIEPAFAAPDIAYARQLLFKIIFPENIARVFEPPIIHGEALDNILFQPFGRPDAESSCLAAVYTVSDRNNSIQIKKLRGIFFAIGGSMFQNGTN